MSRRTLLILAFVALAFIALPGACDSNIKISDCNISYCLACRSGVTDQALAYAGGALLPSPEKAPDQCLCPLHQAPAE